MKEIIISKEEDFHRLYSTYMSTNPLYRGLSDAEHELICRFGRRKIDNKERRDSNSGITYVVDESVEIEIFEEFKNRSIQYLDSKPEDDWGWLALAQHHGLPTRLMDWTTNPLVALYFATINYLEIKDAVIYVFNDRTKLGRTNPEEVPFEVEKVSLLTPRHTTRRIQAQSGLFTVHHSPEEVFDSEYLEKWIIRSSCVVDLKVMCERYGISASSLFPGLDSIADDISMNYC